MPGRGKWVIAVMLLLGLALGGYAWWVQYQKGHRTLEFWGPRAAYLIRHAQRVELLRLNPDPRSAAAPDERPPPTDPPPLLEIAGREVPVVGTREITKVRGLVHARHTLVTDSFYQWDSIPAGEEPRWTFALRFSDPATGERATLAFAPESDRVRLLEEDRETRILSGLSEALDERSRRWFEEASGGEP